MMTLGETCAVRAKELTRITATRILIGYVAMVCATYWVGISLVDMSVTRGHVIGSDGFFYYEYLPALLEGHPFDFCGQRQRLIAEGVPYCWDAYWLRMLPNGHCATPFPPGWAILAAPFFLLAYGISSLGAWFAPVRSDGYGFLYESITNFSAVLYGAVTVVFLYRIARLRLDRKLSLIAAIAVLLASNAIYYNIAQASLAHTTGMCFASIATYSWLRLQEQWRGREAALLSIALFFSILVRPQLGLLAAGFTVQLTLQYKSILKAWPPVIATGAASVLLVLNAWMIYGWFILVPQGQDFIKPFAPKLAETLLSPAHGLFLWHPVYLACMVGLLLSLRTHGRSVGWTVLAILFMQLYLNASVDDWWAGNSFGNRRFIDVLPLFFLGFVQLIKRTKPSLYIQGTLVAILICWNMLFIVQYRFGYIPRDGIITWEMLTVDKLHLWSVPRRY